MYKEPYNYRKVDEFIDWASEISKNNDKDIAFKIITTEIENFEDRYLNDIVGCLNFVRIEAVLDWIENNAHRTINVAPSWGHVAACSHITWLRVDKWLDMGRPLSLIALDTTMYCTTVDERLNQSLIMRELNPRFADTPKPKLIANRLQQYLQTDSVPRTQSVVKKIMDNIFDVRYPTST